MSFFTTLYAAIVVFIFNCSSYNLRGFSSCHQVKEDVLVFFVVILTWLLSGVLISI